MIANTPCQGLGSGRREPNQPAIMAAGASSAMRLSRVLPSWRFQLLNMPGTISRISTKANGTKKPLK